MSKSQSRAAKDTELADEQLDEVVGGSGASRQIEEREELPASVDAIDDRMEPLPTLSSTTTTNATRQRLKPSSLIR